MTTIHTLPVASVVRAGSRHCDVIALGEHTAHLRVIARPEHVLEEKREVIKETTFRNKLISYEEEDVMVEELPLVHMCKIKARPFVASLHVTNRGIGIDVVAIFCVHASVVRISHTCK